MTKYIMAMIVGAGLIDLALAGTTISYWGATQEENRQLSGLEAARREGQLAELKCLDHVITEHPDNAPARSIRANVLVQMGRLDEASKDLDEIARRHPEYSMLPDDWVLYYRIKGDRRNELEALKKVVANALARNRASGAQSPSVRWNRPRIAELSGDIVLAKKEWQQCVESSSGQERASSMTKQVEFCLRQGDYEHALALAKAAVELHRRQAERGYSIVDALNSYGFCLWSVGKRAEALATFLAAAEQSNDESLFAPGALFYRRSLAVLSARALAASGTDKDKAKVTELMSDLRTSASRTNPYSLEPVVLALSGESEVKSAVDNVREVLKQAPNLDWALWAALYLGLSRREDATPLIIGLPRDTLQRHLAEKEGVSPTTQPTNDGRG